MREMPNAELGTSIGLVSMEIGWPAIFVRV